MGSIENDIQDKKVRTRRKKRKIIHFDEELVPKDCAEQFEETESSPVSDDDEEEPSLAASTSKKKKPKRKVEEEEVKEEEELKEEQEDDEDEQKKKKGESKRALKKQKREQQLLDQKIKSELEMQKTCLNYLSQWKHNKTGWKFKKLCQIWLLKNFLNDTKVPNEFWEVTLAYFNSSRGKVRETLNDQCVKIIEAHDATENTEENVQVTRSREILQNLQ